MGVIGVGTVGSQIVLELAKCGVGRFRLVDGDHLEESNRARHVLPERYVGMNKAEALTLHLAEEVPQSRPEAVQPGTSTTPCPTINSTTYWWMRT